MVVWQQLIVDGVHFAIFVFVIWTGPIVLGEGFFVMFAIARCYFVADWDPWNVQD